jgi:large subunit ribosomal protein L22
MAFQASHMYARVTPRKARPLADLVRGLNANRALEVLEFNPRRAAGLFKAVIRSALANAGQKQGVNLNQLIVKEIYVNEGPLIKRGRPVARGRFHRILKKTSHLHVVLDEPAAAGKEPETAAAQTAGGRV